MEIKKVAPETAPQEEKKAPEHSESAKQIEAKPEPEQMLI
jgi:hypothetical protein